MTGERLPTAPGRPLLTPVTQGPAARLRLFCFPYAGGGASSYRRFGTYLPEDIDVWAVQLPGREERFLERPVERLDALLDMLVAETSAHGETPFAFFGHSMGAVIAWELARRLSADDARRLRHVFLSGSRAPQFRHAGMARLHLLPGAELVDAIRALGGTPEDVLADAELMRLLLPVLRADFALLASHSFCLDQPIHVPMTIFGGDDDPRVRPEHLAGWRSLTAYRFSLRLFSGDHFFLHTQREPLLRHIGSELLATLSD